jgi:hypothetical protein
MKKKSNNPPSKNKKYPLPHKNIKSASLSIRIVFVASIAILMLVLAVMISISYFVSN